MFSNTFKTVPQRKIISQGNAQAQEWNHSFFLMFERKKKKKKVLASHIQSIKSSKKKSLICNHFNRNFLLLTGWQLATLFKSQFPTLAFLSLKKPSQSGSFNRTLSMSACTSVNWSIYFWLNTSENYIAKEGCWYSQILKDKGTPLQLGLREASV